MLDCFNRKISYLRISVTDKCNFRCVYCMPEEGVPLMKHEDILTFHEIESVVRFGVQNGIDKIRLTGGEPLTRKGIVSLVEILANIDGIKDFGMTSNAILLPKFAHDLKRAGLQRINISLDTLNEDKFKKLTRIGKLSDVLQGIKAAEKAGLLPIKLNCVIKETSEEPDAQMVADFAKANGYQVRFIREMDLENGLFWKVKGGDGGNCQTCNRLRLTANGDLRPCLFSNQGFNIRELGVEEAYQLALGNKPKSGTFNYVNHFNNIGG